MALGTRAEAPLHERNEAQKTPLVPRPYQRTAIDTAITCNTIVNISTGGGKTLVATKVIDWFLEQGSRIIFVVKDRHLTHQHASYLKVHCAKEPVVQSGFPPSRRVLKV